MTSESKETTKTTTETVTTAPILVDPKIQVKEPQVLTSIEKPTDEDVLFGRGGKTNHHPGNHYFRYLIRTHRFQYEACKKFQKIDLARTIICIIRKNGGRFLEFDRTKQMYFDVGDAKAVGKASQALRDAVYGIQEELQDLKAKRQSQEGSDNSGNDADDGATDATTTKTKLAAASVPPSTSFAISSTLATKKRKSKATTGAGRKRAKQLPTLQRQALNKNNKKNNNDNGKIEQKEKSEPQKQTATDTPPNNNVVEQQSVVTEAKNIEKVVDNTGTTTADNNNQLPVKGGESGIFSDAESDVETKMEKGKRSSHSTYPLAPAQPEQMSRAALERQVASLKLLCQKLESNYNALEVALAKSEGRIKKLEAENQILHHIHKENKAYTVGDFF